MGVINPGLGDALTTDPLSQFAATTSLQLKGVISDETGSGALAFATSPTLVTPVLGTPSSGTLTSCTGLPISTGVSGLGTSVATALGVNVGSAGAFVTFNGALGTPSSGAATNLTGLPLTTGVTGTLPVANGGTGVTTSTGTVAVVLSTSPTLVTPVLGVATGTSLAIGGATIGAKAFAVTGSALFNTDINCVQGAFIYSSVNYILPNVLSSDSLVTGSVIGDQVFRVASGKSFLWTSDGGATVGMRFQSGNLGVGVTPTAAVHLKAGTATVSTAPFKFTSGTNLTTAEAGAMEYNGTNLFFTRAGTVRENVLVAIDNVSAPSTGVGVAIVNFYGAAATNYLGDPNRWLSVNVLGATYKIPLYS